MSFFVSLVSSAVSVLSEALVTFSETVFDFTIRTLQFLIALSRCFDLLVFFIADKGDYCQP